jgi:hypothetical protein
VAAIYLVLWFRVTALRARKAVSIGDGADPQLLLRIRQHGNCAEWSGFVLILMILAEGMGAPALSLHVVGALLVLGRMVHPIGLKIDTASHALRYLGNGSNIAASLVAMASLGIRLANA